MRKAFCYYIVKKVKKVEGKGLVLEPSKKYTQKVEQTFHISQAALDLKSCDLKPIQIVVEYENSNFVLATLSKKAHVFQVPLDLIFKTGDEISFRTIGNGKVHLSGYHVLEDLDGMVMNGEEESDIDELEEMVKVKGKKKKPSPISKRNKRAKLEDENADESDDGNLGEKDEDFEDEEEDFDDEEEDFDDEEDDDSEDEEDEHNISTETKKQKKKQMSNSSLLNVDEDEDEDKDEDEDEEENDEEEEEEEEEMDVDEFDESDEFSSFDLSDLKKGKMNKSGTKKGTQTPNGVGSSSKQKGTPAQKLKNQQEGTPVKGGKTPKSENQQTNEKKSLNTENTPQRKNVENSKKEEKTPKSPKSKDSLQKKVLEGGVISEEIKLGNGPAAKPGKMANVYYVGVLASTKKEFDSVQSGGGFKFRIGRNEVIKGWDIGINGMKVGGKRRLTIPPHLAYGSKGSPPVIPPNSTLVFTVELKGLS